MTRIEIIDYGTKVRDKITGVEGIVTAFGHYYGQETDSYRIEYKNGNGALCADWVFEKRLEIVKEAE